MDTGAPLCTPVPDSSISRAIVVCRDPINRFDMCEVPRSPRRPRTSVRCRIILRPPSFYPFATASRMLGPSHVAHWLDSLGFMNQTICAVWIGDKSRFLSLCYRLAAPKSWPVPALTLATSKKHRQINLFFIVARVVSTTGMLRQLGVAAGASLAESSARQAAQEARLRAGRFRLPLIHERWLGWCAALSGLACLGPILALRVRWEIIDGGRTRSFLPQLERLFLVASSAIPPTRRVTQG